MNYKIKEMNVSKPTKLKEEPNIDKDSVIQNCTFGKYVQIAKNNHISETKIGSYSYTSKNCQIIYSEIGKFVNIASYVRLNPGQHPMNSATQHHMLYRKEMFGFGEDDNEFFDWRKSKKVFIGNDVWIGHNVTIMGGVSIGNGAVIGSGAIVTKSIPPYAIAVGNPAEIIRYRFDVNIIDSLEHIKWWDWNHVKVKKYLNDFDNIKEFIQKHKG